MGGDVGQRKRVVDLPKRSRNSIRPGHIGRLENRGGPSPLTDDDTGRETGFDHASCRAVGFQRTSRKTCERGIMVCGHMSGLQVNRGEVGRHVTRVGWSGMALKVGRRCGMIPKQTSVATQNLLEVFTGHLLLPSEFLVQYHDQCGRDTEKSTLQKQSKVSTERESRHLGEGKGTYENEHHNVSDRQGKRRLSSKEGLLAIIFGEGRKVVVLFGRHGGEE